MANFYGVELSSPLMLGTSQYPSPAILTDAFRNSNASVATASVRREAGVEKAGTAFWKPVSYTHLTLPTSDLV